MLTMGRLQAPAGHKSDIDQHQRRALCALTRETPSYVQKRAAAQPLRGGFGTVPVIYFVWRQAGGGGLRAGHCRG